MILQAVAGSMPNILLVIIVLIIFNRGKRERGCELEIPGMWVKKAGIFSALG